MKNAIIVHGKPTEERYNNPDFPKPHEANWLPWVGARLLEAGVDVSIPPMPRPFFPVYETWKEVFEMFGIDTDTGLVGHSAGSEFILRWLSENKHVSVGPVALVAPYCDEAGKYGDFSSYDLDKRLLGRVGKLVIFNSLDDSLAIQHYAYRLAAELPQSQLIELDGFGHFMTGNNMSNPEFPELVDELLR
mgnify:CR=1 FL=1